MGGRGSGSAPAFYPLYFTHMGVMRLILLAATILASNALQAEETRIALVIGNSDYACASG